MNPAARETRHRPYRLARLLPSAGLALLMLGTLSGAAVVDRAPLLPISPVSLVMQAEGERLASDGQADAATGYFETALAADPRNAGAFVGLGRLARSQLLTGKAIMMFRQARALQPNNRAALAGEADALLARGATDEARTVAIRLRAACGPGPCPELARLEQAFGQQGEQAVLTVDDLRTQPVISSN